MNQLPTLSPNVQPAEGYDKHADGSLEVHSCWYTLQGEGPLAGRPAVFLRLAGCNLQCLQCFGVAVKSRIPYLSRSYGPSVRLDKVKVGEKILTFDADFNLVETSVVQVLIRTATKWVEIRIAGETYDVTPEHPFFTNRGLICAGDLELGDEILEARPGEVIAYKKRGDSNPMKRPEVAAKSKANTNYKQIGKNISKTIKAKQAAGTYVHTFNLLSYEKQIEVKNKMSKSKRRELNPNWSGDNPNLLDVQELVNSGHINSCQKCNKINCRLLVHHLDGNHDNDNLLNLAVWCHKCHNQHHERGYNFWNGKRKDGKELINKHNGQTVEKLTYYQGRLPVMNLSCEPYNTYLANGMWVHNCDTEYTSNRQRFHIDELNGKILGIEPIWRSSKGLHKPPDKFCRLIVVTGGEPFRQNIRPFCRVMVAHGWEVQVETNGSLPMGEGPHPWIDNKFTLVCSPKTPKINDQIENYLEEAGHYKYVLSHTAIDPSDGLPTSVLGMPCLPYRPNSKAIRRGRVWLQPADEGNEETNKKNLQACVDSCLKYGYRLCLQQHKIVGLH